VTFLLDTSGVSEWTKPAPNPGLIGWLASVDEDRVYLSVITIAELRLGMEHLAQGSRRARLEAWLEQDLTARFAGRLLPVDEGIAHAWGRLVERSRAAGRPIGVMDGFIGATAETAGLTLVTRKAFDFAAVGIAVHNPWSQ
jgi:predicted nucleic acid-binding protein